MPLLALAAAAMAGAGAAQNDTASVKAAAGQWLLSEVGGKVACTLDLTDQQSQGARAAKAPFACRQAFPPLQGLSAWSLDDKGDIVLSDAGGKAIVTFAGQPGGPYEAKTASGALWRLQAKPRPGAHLAARAFEA